MELGEADREGLFGQLCRRSKGPAAEERGLAGKAIITLCRAPSWSRSSRPPPGRGPAREALQGPSSPAADNGNANDNSATIVEILALRGGKAPAFWATRPLPPIGWKIFHGQDAAGGCAGLLERGSGSRHGSEL